MNNYLKVESDFLNLFVTGKMTLLFVVFLEAIKIWIIISAFALDATKLRRHNLIVLLTIAFDAYRLCGVCEQLQYDVFAEERSCVISERNELSENVVEIGELHLRSTLQKSNTSLDDGVFGLLAETRSTKRETSQQFILSLLPRRMHLAFIFVRDTWKC